MSFKSNHVNNLLTVPFLISILALATPLSVYASEDINEQLAKENTYDIDSKKDLHMMLLHPFIERGYYIYDENGNELVCNKLTTNEYYLTSQKNYNSYGNIEVKSEYSSWIGYMYSYTLTTYKYDDNQRLDYKAQSYISWTAYTSDGISLGTQYSTISFYNDMGLLTATINFDADNTETRRTVYTYDENGNLLTEQKYDNGKETSRTIYTYDENGNLLTEQDFNKDKEVNRTVYTYDGNGNPLTKQAFRNDKETSRTVYTYDALNHLVQKANVSDKTILSEYTYNDSGELIQEIDYNVTSNDYSTHNYKYSQNGDLMHKSVSFSYDNSFYTEDYEYSCDEAGKLLQKTCYNFSNQGSYIDDYKYEYDQDGDLTTIYHRSSPDDEYLPYTSYIYFEDKSKSQEP